MKGSGLRQGSACLCVLLLALASCSKKPSPNKLQSDDRVNEQRPATLDDFAAIAERGASAMELLLSDGSPPTEGAGAANALAKATQLSASETQQVLARLPDLVIEADDTKDFAKRARSLPPPRTGETVKTGFPPESDRVRPASVDQPDSALKVIRKQPEGDVPIAPHISITFNKPMITIASHADTIAENVPVKVTPKPAGSWRWVGSKTLLFEPENQRFPMSTEYRVEIPAGTKAATGETLAATESWTFTTPTLQMTRYFPTSGTFGLDQLMFVEFDQEIDQAAMLASIKVKTGNVFGAGAPVKLALPERINADERIKAHVESAQPNRYIVLQPAGDLPYDSSIQVVVQKGAPSAEGPRRTPADTSFGFQTYGPLEVSENRCGYGDCNPHDAFSFRFTNRLDDEKFDDALIKVEPSFPTMNIQHYGDWVHVYGQKPGRRTYKVTIDRTTTDEFGQTLRGTNTFSYDVGPSVPNFYSTADVFNVLDPSGDPAFTVFSTNYAELRVKAWRVEPKDWGDYLAYVHDYRYYGKREVKPPGKLVMDEKVAVSAKPDDLVETAISLNEAMGATKRGNLVIFVSPSKVTKGSTMPENPPEVRTWVQATNIGLDALVDDGELVGWATSLDAGKPLGGATLELGVSAQRATADKNGIGRFDLVPFATSWGGKPNYLIAKHGKDSAFLPESLWGLNQNTTWAERKTYDSLAWFVFDDRNMYRPKETVTVKGWIRAVENREGGDIKLSPGTRGMSYVVYGSQGNELAKGETKTTGLGGFSFDFKLPETPNLGQARILLSASGAGETNASYNHYFQIQEFRTPEFEVKASAGEGPYYATDSAIATVEAKYYAGGGLPNADTTWNVTATSASFTPPNQVEYTFGSWTPWWVSSNNNSGAETNSQTLQSKTDATGTHHVKIAFGSITPPRPMSVRAQATVMDVNRQAWSASTNFIVHPSNYYVGLKTDRYFVDKGTPLRVDLVVTDVEGNRVVDRPVKVRAARVDWKYSRGTYEEVEKDVQDCPLMTKDGQNSCTFKTDVGGTYRIVATTVDDFGRTNFSELTRWVSGGKSPVARRVERENVDMIPNKDEYQPGETAEILVQSPIVPAEGIYTLQRNGMVEEHHFTMSEPTMTLKVPIKNVHFPNLTVQINVVGSQPRLTDAGEADASLPRRPAYGQGAITLKIPPRERQLAVTVSPKAARVSPGDDTTATVVVRGADGAPVANAEVALVVVDEAILALSSYSMADPMNVFYPQRPSGVRTHHLRQSVALADPTSLKPAESPPGDSRQEGKSGGKGRSVMMKKAPASPSPARVMSKQMAADSAPMAQAEEAPMGAMIGGDGGGGADSPIAVRTNFNPLAVFAPAQNTNAAGQVEVSYKMPDNLTRYRIMAVAVENGTRFGTGESNVTSRLPLMVRPSAPRFLNFGDKFQLPVVLQNQTDEPMTVSVATRGTNVEFTQALGWKVQIAANDRVEVRFGASTAMAGTARFQVGASAGKWSDASEFSLPVWTPATSEAFATYGVIDEGSIVQPVAAPTEVWPQFGGLEVTTSSTALQALTDAFLYLYAYQYQCAEQISSRMVSVAALRDVLSAFQAEGMPSAAEVTRSMSRDIEELASRQNYDGGFGLWRAGQPSWPYVAIHASHALVRAKDKGYDVPEYVLTRSKSYLQNIESYIPHWWSLWSRLHVIAYSLYVRNLMGDRDPAKAREVIKRGKKLDDISFESVGWLLGVMTGQKGYEADVAEIRRFLNNRVTETAAGAHFAAHTQDSAYLIMYSDRVADGVILEAMIDDEPNSNLIPKIVNGLLAHRKRGRWGNTQENAFVLLALDKYFNKYEKKTPDFVARVWLGDQFAGEHKFKGRTTERHHIDVPMKYVVEQGKAQKLYLQKDGSGRMYYRIGMNYAPKSLYLEPAEHGFVVQRAYEPVDDDADVKRRSDGAWEIKAGAKVRIKLTMVAQTRRYHVALVDPLPAGLEIMNPALAVTGDIPQDQGADTGRSGSYGWWWWTRPWFEHQNMRDERVEAFTTLLWGGVHTYTYYARATTPGEFVVPPTKAEEMYTPETFGRSASDRVFVVD